MWEKLVAWWEFRTRSKELRGPLPIHVDVLRDRSSKAEIQVMSILALLVVLPIGAAAYYYYTASQRAERDLADGIRLVTPGHYEEATMLLTKAIDKLSNSHPNRYMAYLMRASAYRQMGERDRSKQDFAQSIALRGDCARCYVERAGLEREMKDYTHALEDLDRAQAFERTPENHVERASIFEEQNKLPQAIEELSKAISMRENWPHIYRARARLRKATGDMEGFEADKQAVIRIDHGW